MIIMTRTPLIFFIVCLNYTLLFSQTFSVLSWNIQNLGRSKDDTEIQVIVDILKSYDLVAIQEVVAKDPAGAQKVAQLADELNRKGAKWEYRVSPPTQSPSSYISERYAILWKPSKLELLGSPFLDKELGEKIHREPFLAKFRIKKGRKNTFFYIVNFHARRFNLKPQQEIQYFQDYLDRLGARNFIIAGDFNLNERHKVWRKLYRQGFSPAVERTPTTLKRKCKGKNYLNYPIDNIYYPSYLMRKRKAGSIDFVGECANLETARGVSDHLPIFAQFEIR